MRRLKVLHIVNGYWSSNLYKELISKLSSYSITQTVFIPIRNDKQKNINSISKDNVTLIYSRIISSIIYRIFFHLKILKTIKRINKTIDIKEINIIHAHSLFSDGAVAFHYFNSYNIPYIVAIRNTDVNVFFKYFFYLRPLGTRILKNASNIVFLSEAYQNRVFNKYVPKEIRTTLLNKALVIPNGINTFWIENLNQKITIKNPEEHFDIIFVGEIRKNKNILGTIEAIKILISKAYKIRFTIIGEGLNDELAYLNKVKNAAQANNFINILPVMGKKELLNYYRKSSIFAMPSFTESFGLVYAEALSQGLPIIYSKDEGFDKVFKDGEVGYSVDAHSINSISDGIENIINNYNKIQNNCSKNIKQFNWENIAKTYFNTYLKRINENKTN